MNIVSILLVISLAPFLILFFALLFVDVKYRIPRLTIHWKDSTLAVFSILFINQLIIYLSDNTANSEITGSVALYFISGVVLAPIAEELAYRHLIYRKLKTKFSVIIATTISSVLWSVSHVTFELHYLIALVISGFIYCDLYERRGLQSVVFVHAFVNFAYFTGKL